MAALDVADNIENFKKMLFENDINQPSNNFIRDCYNSLTSFASQNELPELLVSKLVECTAMYIRFLLNYCDGRDLSRVRWFKVKRLFACVKDVFSSYDMKNSFIVLATESIFDLILIPRSHSWPTKELLRTYNAILGGSSKTIRKKACEQIKSIYWSKLLDMLEVCGDYEEQTIILEVVFRMCDKTYNAKDLFPESKKLRDALMKINVATFDEDVRIFLNEFNSSNSRIFSVLCLWITLDDIEFKQSTEKRPSQGIWMDFDLKDRTLSCSCDRRLFLPGRADETNSWDVVYVFAIGVDDVNIKRCGSHRQHLIVTLTLNRPCVTSNITTQTRVNNARVLKFSTTDPETINHLILNVFPILFGKKYTDRATLQCRKSKNRSTSVSSAASVSTGKVSNKSSQSGSVITISSGKTEDKIHSNTTSSGDYRVGDPLASNPLKFKSDEVGTKHHHTVPFVGGIETASTVIYNVVGGMETTSTGNYNVVGGIETASTVIHNGVGGIETASTVTHNVGGGNETASTFIHNVVGGIETASTVIHNIVGGIETARTIIHNVAGGIETTSTVIHNVVGGIETASRVIHNGVGGTKTSTTVIHNVGGIETATTVIHKIETNPKNESADSNLQALSERNYECHYEKNHPDSSPCNRTSSLGSYPPALAQHSTKETPRSIIETEVKTTNRSSSSRSVNDDIHSGRAGSRDQNLSAPTYAAPHNAELRNIVIPGRKSFICSRHPSPKLMDLGIENAHINSNIEGTTGHNSMTNVSVPVVPATEQNVAVCNSPKMSDKLKIPAQKRKRKKPTHPLVFKPYVKKSRNCHDQSKNKDTLKTEKDREALKETIKASIDKMYENFCKNQKPTESRKPCYTFDEISARFFKEMEDFESKKKTSVKKSNKISNNLRWEDILAPLNESPCDKKTTNGSNTKVTESNKRRETLGKRTIRNIAPVVSKQRITNAVQHDFFAPNATAVSSIRTNISRGKEEAIETCLATVPPNSSAASSRKRRLYNPGDMSHLSIVAPREVNDEVKKTKVDTILEEGDVIGGGSKSVFGNQGRIKVISDILLNPVHK